ncbi:ABC transporter permease subunit [Evansella cellulosilytica]|uniref:ABC transporter permease n=1 Tax=Evansella cellulosilytica (strain ATCC 21833 / DSM 2522 / FERM P-1141 / JCM 9156 / N-4) TaxID=649639 RepID=E6TUC7_EVAC2|nr:ABC transporter permease subunit [Evansella cellulosilytica]ADU29683.1 hypothetical protein Bcell_1420 [Evansella cellulosilytica DSM 2522]
MFHKALWYQNFKQTKILMFFLLVLYIIHLPFQAMLQVESWRVELEEFGQINMYYWSSGQTIYFIFSEGALPIFIMIAIIFLACLLIGVERNTRRMDFTFSFPFKRRDIFLSKMIYGMFMIISFHTINFLVAYLILFQSEFRYTLSDVTMTNIYFGPLIVFLFIFTFALFIGTITGEMISQVVLTFIFGIFPLGIAFLIITSMDIHRAQPYYREFPYWVETYTPLFYITSTTNGFINSVLYPLIGLVIFAILSILLYQKNKIEHNGEFLIFKQLHPIFKYGIIICFSLFGGIIISSLAPWGGSQTFQIIGYWIGFVIFALFSYLISRRLLNMNVLVRNK